MGEVWAAAVLVMDPLPLPLPLPLPERAVKVLRDKLFEEGVEDGWTPARLEEFGFV
jgi:hypothetical protein